jgi:hypothetical protein
MDQAPAVRRLRGDDAIADSNGDALGTFRWEKPL